MNIFRVVLIALNQRSHAQDIKCDVTAPRALDHKAQELLRISSGKSGKS